MVVREDIRRHKEQDVVWTGNVSGLGRECPEPIVICRSCGTDKQKDWYVRHSGKTLLGQLVSGNRWGSRSPRTADRVERYVQQTWTESKFGEDGGNVDGT